MVSHISNAKHNSSSGGIQDAFPQPVPTLVSRDDSHKALLNNTQAHQSKTMSADEVTKVIQDLQSRAMRNATVTRERGS